MEIVLSDFAKNATNVYRTKDYIVKQTISVRYDSVENNGVISHDVYYKRTKERDKRYEEMFFNRRNINGKRLPTTMYSRVYVE